MSPALAQYNHVTTALLSEAQAARVPKLVYTSSASVVFEGKDLVDVNEDQPYASRPLDFYTRTKVCRSVYLGLSDFRPAGMAGVQSCS